MLHELTALPSDGFYIIRNGTLACSFTPQYPKKSIGFLEDPKAAFTLQYIDTLSEDIVRGDKGGLIASEARNGGFQTANLLTNMISAKNDKTKTLIAPMAQSRSLYKRATINYVPKSIFVLSIMQSVIAIHEAQLQFTAAANSWRSQFMTAGQFITKNRLSKKLLFKNLSSVL